MLQKSIHRVISVSVVLAVFSSIALASGLRVDKEHNALRAIKAKPISVSTSDMKIV